MQTNIDDTLAALVAAWDSGDARAYADLFSEHATYVTFAGTISRGREQIRRDHVPVLEKYRKGSRMRLDVLEIRPTAEDRAVVLTRGGVGSGRRVPADKVQTLAMVREADGAWRCEAFHNTKRNPLLAWVMDRSVR